MIENMKKLPAWLADMFKVEVVWIEKDHGDWVKRRRYHPAAKLTALVCFLFLVFSWGRYLLREPEAPDTEAETPYEVSSEPPEAEFPQRLRMTDFPHRPAYPGPIPYDMEIAEDEYWVRVSKGNYRLYLYRGRGVEKSYEIAVGRNSGDKERVGDNRTPTGAFTVQSIEDSRSWTFDFKDGKGPTRGAYGPWFIRLRTRWRGIGIHGTHDPDSLGTMISEGCVRMHNSELEELKQFARINMKVVIEE